MKYLLIALLTLLATLQYKLWLSPNGLVSTLKQRHTNLQLMQTLTRLQQSNHLLTKRIKTLRSDPQTIEFLARQELGMVKKNEVFYQIIPQ